MISIVDLRIERKEGNYSLLSQALIQEIQRTLARKEQVLLFHNRRGLATSLLCEECGHHHLCPHCDVTMTYHRKAAELTSSIGHFLMCHYCGRTTHVPTQCPSCQSHRIKPMGSGTQQVEETLRQHFPAARILRIDRDSTGKKHSHEEAFAKVHDHDVDIIIGTQMITKGHDFPKVTLVGVLLADMGLSIPDFRSRERVYQLLTQVAGRTGRRGQASSVIIQTFNPEDITPAMADEYEYHALYEQEITERSTFGYPPFGELIKLTYVHPQREKALSQAKNLLQALQAHSDTDHQLHLAPALIPKLHNNYHINILIKGPHPRTILRPLLPLPALWRIDVDPISVL